MRKAQSTPTNPKGAQNLPPIRRKLVTELPRPARPMMISARIKVTPKNNTIRMNGFVEGMIGEKGKRYVPYLVTVLVYIGFSNVIGLFGLKPPTKDMNVTAALALMSIILIEASGIREKGVKNWLKGFAQPVAVITPINILEVFIRPLSLCMRLFGNVLGAFVIMELIKQLIPVGVPLVFSFYFDIFDGLIQAYVFVFLTSLFIKEAIED